MLANVFENKLWINDFSLKSYFDESPAKSRSISNWYDQTNNKICLSNNNVDFTTMCFSLIELFDDVMVLNFDQFEASNWMSNSL